MLLRSNHKFAQDNNATVFVRRLADYNKALQKKDSGASPDLLSHVEALIAESTQHQADMAKAAADLKQCKADDKQAKQAAKQAARDAKKQSAAALDTNA